MKIVILGDGLLGSEIISQTSWDFISRKKDGFDIRDDSHYIQLCAYDVVVNCIAHTDTYTKDKELHWDINYRAVIKLTNFCEANNIKLVHISTDYVYTNSNSNASEDDIPIHGNNWYSYTKLLGDSYVQLNKNNLVLRGTHKQTPFPYANAWVDQIGNFDYVDVIASLIIQLINKNVVGVINIGTELKSMYTLALQTNYNISPALNTFAPANVSMNVSKIKGILK